MPRRGENIRKRADGRWEARYIKSRTPDGRAEYGYVYAKTYAEARQKKQEALAARKPERPDAHGESLGAVMLLWLNGKKSSVKPSTYANYAAIVQNHLLPAMGDLPAERLTTALVDEYVAQNLEDPQEGRAGLSAKTISDHLAVLKLIADYAREMGLLPDTVIRFHRPRLHAPAIDILPPEEQAKLESHLLTRLDSYALGVLLTLYTGLRIGELCALRFCDIDLEEGLLEVNATMLRIRETRPNSPARTRLLIDAPKTRSSKRKIPLSQFFVTEISALRRRAGRATDYLLTASEQFIEPRNYYERYQRMLREAGLPPHSFHALRHTFATRCIENGLDPKSVSELLGHANVRITLERYVHPSLEGKRKFLERFSPANRGQNGGRSSEDS